MSLSVLQYASSFDTNVISLVNPPTANNFLLLSITSYNGNQTIINVPAGFTVISNASYQQYGGVTLYAKRSDGTEQTITYSDSNNSTQENSYIEITGATNGEKYGIFFESSFAETQGTTSTQTALPAKPTLNAIPITYFTFFDPSDNNGTTTPEFPSGWTSVGPNQAPNSLCSSTGYRNTLTTDLNPLSVNCSVDSGQFGTAGNCYWCFINCLVYLTASTNSQKQITDLEVVFDSQGYPITVFVDNSNNISLYYWLNGFSKLYSTGFQGKSPNLFVYNNEIFIMYVPITYTDSLMYLNSSNNFQQPQSYFVGIQNGIKTFSLQQNDNNLKFSFVNNNNLIYYAQTTYNSSLAQFSPIQNVQFLTNGKESYTTSILNYDFVLYRGVESNNDTYAYLNQINNSNTFNWSPPLGEFSYLVQRQNVNQDIHNSTINLFNNAIGIAWLETTKTGVLRLNYAENVLTNTPNIITTDNKNQIYIYSYIGQVFNNIKSENIPFNLRVIDSNNAQFDFDPYQGVRGLGYNVETQNNAKSLQFLQSFRQPTQVLAIKLTTAPAITQLQGQIPLQPLSFYVINIYSGDTNLIFKSLITDINGTTSLVLPSGLFKFEILTLAKSILWSQTLL